MNLNEVFSQVDKYYQEKRGKEAEKLMCKAIKQVIQEGDDKGLLQLVNELLGYYRETSQVENSLVMAEQALTLTRKMGLEGQIPYATTLLNVANAYRAAGKLKESQNYYEQVQEIFKAKLEPDNMLVASLNNNLSLLYQEMGRFGEAKECLLRALPVVQAKNAEFEVAVTYANLASTCMGMEAKEEANIYAKEAIRRFDEIEVKDAHYAAALAAHATYYFKKEKYSQALELYKEAMQLVDENLGQNEYYHRLQEHVAACEQKLGDEDFSHEAELLALERAKAERREAERLEAERREAERLEAERREAERLEAERREAERLEAERREAERLEAERREAERLEAERREAERLEAERREAERLEAERREAERLEAERREAERREAERLEAERREAERLEAERREAERLEAERREAERLEAERREAERREAERLEAERREAERLEAERREAERIEAERREAERLEAERREAERREAERLEAERREAERLEAERREAERLEAERREAERLEAERREAERLEAERREAERLEAERREAERLEAERREAERLEAERREAERREAERLEAERREAERLEAERREAERLEAERREAERREAERLEAERREAERIEAERREAERLEAERREAERLEAERREAERLEAERREAERLEAERREAERLEAERREAERKEAERQEAIRLELERAMLLQIPNQSAKVKEDIFSFANVKDSIASVLMPEYVKGDKKCKRHKTSKRKLKEEILKFDNTEDDFEEEIESKSQDVPDAAAQDSYVEMQDNHVEVECNRTEVQDHHEELQDNYAEVQDHHEELQDNYAEVQDNHDEVQDNHTEVQDNYEEVQDNYVEVQDSHEEAQDNYVEVQDNHEEAQDIYVEMQDNHEEMQDNHEELKANSEATQDTLQDAQENRQVMPQWDTMEMSEKFSGEYLQRCESSGLRGLDLCREYYEVYVKKMIEDKFALYVDRIAVGLVGEGSDCFGYDDELSRDHDWGPEICLWLTDETFAEIGASLEEAYAQLPKEFKGYKFIASDKGNGRRGVKKISEFYHHLVQSSFYEGIDWRTVTDASLAAAVNGEVFYDKEGIFSGFREKLLQGYPNNIRNLKIAESMARFSQSGQYNFGRVLKRGDILTAQMMLADCTREAMKLQHYIEGKYPPHDKWLYRSILNSEEGRTLANNLLKLQLDVQRCIIERNGLDVECIDVLCEDIENIASFFSSEMYVNHVISDSETFLDQHTDELVQKAEMNDKSDEELIDRIIELEFEAFDKVQNKGGRASCQDDWKTFSIMRKSQYQTWNREMLQQYLYDFERSWENGHNLIEEKYGRMMESTAPKEYEEMKGYFPEISPEKKKVIEGIIPIQVAWMEDFSKQYPYLAYNTRSIGSTSDSEGNTSFETYLRGEVSTYSDKMLELYGRFVADYAKKGRNLTTDIMQNSVVMYGYGTLESAESFIKYQSFWK